MNQTLKSARKFLTCHVGPWLSVALCFGIFGDTSLRGADDNGEFFEARIRPVLIKHCYSCHNSRDRREGGLALDSRDAMLAGGDSGTMIVKGNVSESSLLAILRHEVPGLEMPQGEAKLGDQIIADFEQWIRLGAPDPRDHPPTGSEWDTLHSWQDIATERLKWWSFQPISDAPPPTDDSNRWSDHPIDRFIWQKLTEVGLTPAESAAPSDLVRRTFLTLTGLPPSQHEAQTWTQRLEEAPDRDHIFSELVEHLLNQPTFGERWARHWMDWIRYAESHGSEGDPVIDHAWHYRDYLIRAFNQDIPIDQLIREQIAGDLLDAPRSDPTLRWNESLIGTAHWRMVFHGFSPTDPLEEKVRFVDDQINAISKGFLGLTVSCARCHDHKFDPISQKDYYATFGVLASTRPGRTPVETLDEQNRYRQELSELKLQIRKQLAQEWLQQMESFAKRERWFSTGSNTSGETVSDLRYLIAQVQAKLQEGVTFEIAWREVSEQLRSRLDTYYRVLNVDSLRSWEMSQQEVLDEWTRTGNGLVEGVATSGAFAIEPSGEFAVQGIYPAGVYSHLLSQKHAARLTSRHVNTGNGKFEIWLEAIGDSGATCRYAVHDFPRDGTIYPVTRLVPRWQWHRFDVSFWSGEEIHLELTCALDAPLLVTSSPRSWFGIRRAKVVPLSSPFPQESVEHFEPILELATRTHPTDLEDLYELYDQAIRTALQDWERKSIRDAQALLLDAALRSGWLSNQLAELPKSAGLIERFRSLEAEVPIPTRVPTLEEAEVRDHPLYVRGDSKKPEAIVPRRFLAFIDQRPYDSSNSGRRQLAEDLLRNDNPLTRRVLANRVWQHLFGQGIVRTTDNFGRLGDVPSHPELLDWLAREWDRQRWSLKSLIKTIVTSKTWRQTTIPNRQALEIDPENRYLSHAYLRRLEAEAIRDSILMASGSLDTSMGGSPVDGAQFRRSIYVRVHRNSLDPFLRAFDFPEPFSSVGHRMVTNVPAQALALMNDSLVERCASHWAATLSRLAEQNSDRDAIEHLFWQALGRSPSVQELDRCLDFLKTTHEEIQDQHRQLGMLRSSLAALQREEEELYQRAAERTPAIPVGEPSTQSLATKPIMEWDFTTQHGRDSARGTLQGNAVFTQDGLQLLGGFWISEPLECLLAEKSVEVWLVLEDLEQSGGGALSIQTLDGSQFDAVVFGELEPGKWIAGSDFHRRTQSFNGEPEQIPAPVVQVVLTYQANGTITAYRNGELYGRPYQKGTLLVFPPRQSLVTFGLRHLPATDGRMFYGRILRGLLYDRPLPAEEVDANWQTFSKSSRLANWKELLTDDERALQEKLTSDRISVQSELSRIHPPASAQLAAWTELARSIFSLKEFIYVR